MITSVSMSQKSGHSLTGYRQLRVPQNVSHRLWSRSRRAAVISRPVWGGPTLSPLLWPLAGLWSLLVIGWRYPFLAMWASLHKATHNSAAGIPQNEQIKTSKQKSWSFFKKTTITTDTRLHLLEQFRFTAKLNTQYKVSYTPPSPTHVQPPIPLTSPTRVVHFLQLMSLHWHTLITRSPYFTSGFSLGDIHFIGFDKCILTGTLHYGNTQNSFTALKILWAFPVHPSLSSVETTDLLLSSLLFSFPEYHIQQVTFIGSCH